MDEDCIRFGDLRFYRLSSGTVVPIYDAEMRRNLTDWFSIETTDPEDQNDDEDEDHA